MGFLDFANILQTKIIYIFAYFPVITLIGFLQAWINSKLDDDTAKNWGFLTLDPTVHFDTYGFFVLVFPWQLFGIDLNIGFGKLIPYNPDGIYGRFVKLKKIIILFSASIAAFIASLIFGFLTTIIMVSSRAIMAQISAKFLFAFLRMVEGLVSLSSELFFIYFIINLVDAFLYKFDKDDVIKSNVFLRFLIIILAAIFVAPIIRLILLFFISFLLKFLG